MNGRITSQGGEAGSLKRDFQGTLVLGRAANCDLVLPLPTVSSRHASIRYDAEQEAFILEDLGSTHGTALDGTPVSGSERLGHLNVISLSGSVDLLFQDLTKCAARHGGAAEATDEGTVVQKRPEPPPPVAQDPVPPARKEPPAKPDVAPEKTGEGTVIGRVTPPPPVQTGSPPAGAQVPPSAAGAASAGPATEDAERTVLGNRGSGPVLPPADEPPPAQKTAAQQQVRLVFTNAIDEIRAYPLKPGENTIGRGVANDVTRARAEVSRAHAVISLRDGKIFARDNGSSHGTTVNGLAISDEVEIEVGATISFGIDDARLEAE